MYLKSIELSGFKSFAKKNFFEFNTPISSIVGPNGSGKSNVAEAFRFVLGEQSIKSLRGKRGEDLIWNGAQSEPRANRASVKVTFDNTRKIFDIDFPEVTLERVVHRDGLNEYFINGSLVRLKDVLELLSRAHIGASGHHIISQGEADKVVSANPKDRKDMVLDALGLKLYQYKRVESERKLRKTFENIGQVEALRKEIAPHLKFLEKQVEKIEKTESLREELIAKAQEYFKLEDLHISGSRKVLETERKPLEDAQKKLGEELAKARKVLADNAQKEKKDYIVLELENSLTSTRILKDAQTRELGKVEGLMDAQLGIIKKQQQLAASDEHKMIPLKDVLGLYKEIEEEREDTGLFGRIKEKFFNFIKSRRENLSSNILKEAEAALAEHQKEKKEVEKKLAEAEAKEKELRERYEVLKKEIDSAKDTGHDAERAVFHIMSEENDLIAKLNLLKMREEEINRIEQDFRRELEELGHLVGAQALHFKDVVVEAEDMSKPLDSLRQSSGQVARGKQDERRRLIEKLKVRLEDSSLAGSEEVEKEFRETSERDQFLSRELLDLEKSAETLKELIKDLEERLAVEFKTGLENINKEFDKLFTTMFGGGEAELILVKSELKKDEEVETDEDGEKVEEGLEIKVSLPKKKIRGLMML